MGNHVQRDFLLRFYLVVLGNFEPLLTWKLIMSSNLDIFEAPV